MKCQACHTENRQGRKFCSECGARLVLVCPACAAPNEPTDGFCGECGSALGRSGKPAAAIDRSPSAYTPKHLADRILQSRSALEGERKQVTVLFADVKGSMELAEQLDPEEWHRILERFFAILTEGVHRFEGTVNQYTGDGIMALFGAPIAHEDHAQRACYAALALRDSIERYATEVKREHGISFSTRMGLNSGEVVVGRIGDDLRMDYTAQGHTVGLAQRMESLASPDSCYLTAATAALVGGYFALEDLGEFRVKGVAEPVRVHRLMGVGAARTRFDISRAKGLSRFVGRAADLRTLEDAVTQTAAGNGQVVGVVADAGTGKSRLCFEFLERCRARGMRVYEGHAVAHGRNIPLLPILEVFRAYFGITAQDDDRSAREKIAGRMVVLDQGLAESLPLLFDFLGVADPQRSAPAMSPEVRQRQIFQVMRQVIRSASETQPTVTLIEDLHWIDAASGEFLAQMVDAQAGTRSLLLVNFRPEYRAEWMQKSWYRQIPLTPLGREAIVELLADLLGSDPSLAPLADAIHLRSGGNPFFAEEITQSLIESGQLQGTRGVYRLVTSIDRLDVPATVQAVLAARIDRLPEREKQLLQVASVIGKDFSEPLLEAVAGLPGSELKASLLALRRAEFLHEQAIYPVVEYAFKHPLTQEVALGSQLKQRRRAVHAAVAEALQASDGNLDELAGEIAQHWAEAQDRASAVRWYGRAAEWVGRSSFREGLSHWRRVRGLAPYVDAAAERDALTLRACVNIFNGSWRAGGTDQDIQAVFEEGRELAERLDDRRVLAMLICNYGLIRLVVGGSADDLVRYSTAAADIAEDISDPGFRAAIWTRAAWGAFCSGRPRACQRWAARIVDEVGTGNRVGMDHLGESPRAIALNTRAWSLLMLGQLTEAEMNFNESIRSAQDAGNPELGNFALIGLIWLGFVKGGDPASLDQAQRAMKLAEAEDNDGARVYALAGLGAAHLQNGQFEAARDACRASITLADNLRAGRHWHPVTLAVMSHAHGAIGETAEALVAAREGVEFADAGGLHYFGGYARIALAAALTQGEGPLPLPQIDAELDRVEHLTRSAGIRSFVPSIREMRARVAARSGDEAATERLLQEALQAYREIGATGHVARLTMEFEA